MEKKNKLLNIKEKFKEEVPEDTPNSIVFHFRLPYGEKLTRRFLKSDKIEVDLFVI